MEPVVTDSVEGYRLAIAVVDSTVLQRLVDDQDESVDVLVDRILGRELPSGSRPGGVSAFSSGI